MGKYEEALERARQGLPMEQVFPELKGSEDERIRKGLVHFILYEAGNLLDEETEHKFVAYLERQKEQQPVHTAKEMWKEMRLEVYAQASGNRHEPNYSDDSTKMFSLRDIDEIFEKIGNSVVGLQPAEWSEEDVTTMESCMLYLANARDCIAFSPYIGANARESGNKEIQKDIDWLKSIRPDSYKNCNSRWKPSEEQSQVADASKIEQPEGGCSEKPNDLLSEPETDLEKAARDVYGSWMAGTMDDVRRDMIELGKVLNARKEE